MAAENYLQSEDQFLCSICLDVFTDPVTIPCGHNFCKNCITEHWNTNDQYLCPMCEEAFTTRPDLRVNTLFSEMLAQFRQSAQQKASSSSSSEQQVSKPGEVPCDVCTGTKLKVELGKTGAEIQQMIQKRRLKIQEVKHSVDLSEEDADREIAEGVQVFTSLKESVERGLNELINTIKEKQKTRETQAEAFIKELEQEISELMKRSTEVEQVLRTEDHLHLLQSVQSLNIQQPPPTKDWIKVSVHQSYEGTVVKAVTQLEETLSQEMKKLLEAELKRVQQYAVDVTLDPDTAHPNLILSDDGKQVYRGGGKKNLPDNPERFSLNRFVLGRQSFSSGRFYFEVQVKGKTKWDLGVARESIARKASIPLNPQYGNWTIWLRNGCEYKALDAPPVRLSLKSRPQKVGVFVDYEEGLVSFYDVAAASLIYSFNGCSFKVKLFPFFHTGNNYGGKNSAPLIISPVRVN
ncbi:E3 ubiquitin-protein ligase TRIM21-like isoform X3 [Sander lucioperca]|uniref:E3 ubiquitin-protein ligase TRIM21-like isoform X3 n=1 Tax=Sander lucioperca TaxID=283035 RepID=UPI001653C88F|nr:E3 ubiquitin-protein ligase TRIM21-like isoform X3 [Sander lucioperca]